MDVWVKHSQEWLNATYGSNPGFISLDEDGMTGWSTIYALTRALQIELNISPTSSSFGPTTLSRLTSQVGDVSAATATQKPNIVGILQCAMWCKGYWGHTTFGQWDISLGNAIMQVRGDMGLSPYSPTVTPKMFKSLLTMSAYTLVTGGDAAVRAIQQWMNGRYLGRADFYLVPCDGTYSRDVQRGLMLAIQYEIGMADGTANGNFGPGTKAGLQAQANLSLGSTDSTKQFVHLYQAALTFNQYPTAFDGVFGSGTRSQTDAFQAFSALPVSWSADFATWASLLVSTGDTSRPGTAIDCITTITNARALTLYNAGYRIVGRYLTNSAVPDALDKCIKPGELATLALNGLSVFPIFQEGGDGVDYFSWLQGYQAGLKAHAAATGHGFDIGTHIYFAVDFDAYESEVTSAVIPHFEGIRDAFDTVNSLFKVGVYGARNTCAIVSAHSLAELSFVGDMSTGYSGNLGFPLPANWAFDQILEYSIGSGSGAIGIDKDIVSGRDTGQSTSGPGITLLDYIDWLHNRALLYRNAHPGVTTSSSALVLHYLRHDDYDGLDWDATDGEIDDDFIDDIDSAVWYRVHGIVSPGNNRYIDASHLAATANGYLKNALTWTYMTAHVTVGDMTGWAGDLVQVMAGWVNQKRANPSTALSAYDYGRTYIARLNPDSNYSAGDFDEDIDALNIVRGVIGSDIDDVMRGYYAPDGGCLTRYSRFAADRFFDDWDYARQVGVDIVDTLDALCVAVFEGILLQNLNGAPGLLPGELTPSEWLDFVDAWIDTLQQKISEE